MGVLPIGGWGGSSGGSLPAGTSGYIMRYVGGSWVANELSASGLAAARPAAGAAYGGQFYWSTDAAAGLELAECVHKAGATYAWEVVPYGATATGIALVQAANPAAALAVLGITTPSHTSGTLAARPASPAAGDTYAVTSGVGTGDRYQCFVAGAWTLVACTCDLGAVTATGATAKAAKEAVGITQTSDTYDFSSSTGWTLTNGLGTAAITGGACVLTTPTGVNTQTPNRPNAAITLDHPAVRGCDVAVRLAGFTGTGSFPRCLVNLSNKADGANATYTGTDYGISVLVLPDGSVTVGDFIGGAAFASRVTTAAAVMPIDGTGWIRIITSPGGYTALTGVGATLAAAVWTVRWVQANASATAALTTLTLCGYRADTTAETWAATYDDLTIVVQ